MAGPAILKIQVVTDVARAVAGLKDVSTGAESMGKKSQTTSQRLGSMAKTAGKVAGAAALGGLVLMLHKGVGEQSDYLSGQAQLANGLKSTGNAANTSVKEMEGLASSIQNYSGQTDDSIVASEKLLLTFTNVGNKAGKNNDIFNQATKMTADMAAKMGGDASKYAVQLGKALNDPVKGITALTRVGVTFTEGQKKSIKSMQESGNTLGAQKIIMAELQKEFGGSAKAAGQTLPGQMQRAQRSFEDISQSLVAGLMPALTSLAGFLLNDILPAFKAVMDFIMAHKTVFVVLATVIGILAAAIKIATVVQTLFNVSLMTSPIFWIVAAIVALVAVIAIVVQRTIGWKNVFKALGTAAKAVWNALRAAFNGIKKVISKVFDWLLHSKIAAVLLGPWRIALGALNALVKGGISGVLKYFSGLMSGLVSILAKVWSVVTTPFRTAFNWVVSTAKTFGTAVVSAVKTVVTNIGTAIATVYTKIVTPFSTAFTWVTSNVSKLWNAFTSVATNVASKLTSVAGKITAPFSSAFTWVKNNVSKLWTAFTQVATNVANKLTSVTKKITAPFSSAYSWVSNNVHKLWDAFVSVATWIGRKISGVTDAITAPFSAAWSWIKRNVVDKITGAFSGIGSALKSPINAVIRGWNNLSFTIGGWKLPFPPHTKFPSVTINTPNIRELARGAYVTSPMAAIVGEAGPEIVAPEAILRKILAENGGGTTIIVNGALDPDAVARQIDNLLTQRRRRNNGVRQLGAPLLAGT